MRYIIIATIYTLCNMLQEMTSGSSAPSLTRRNGRNFVQCHPTVCCCSHANCISGAHVHQLGCYSPVVAQTARRNGLTSWFCLLDQSLCTVYNAERGNATVTTPSTAANATPSEFNEFHFWQISPLPSFSQRLFI